MIRRSPLPALAAAFAMIAGAAVIAAIPQPAAAQTSAASPPAADAPRKEPKRGHGDLAGAEVRSIAAMVIPFIDDKAPPPSF